MNTSIPENDVVTARMLRGLARQLAQRQTDGWVQQKCVRGDSDEVEESSIPAEVSPEEMVELEMLLKK